MQKPVRICTPQIDLDSCSRAGCWLALAWASSKDWFGATWQRVKVCVCAWTTSCGRNWFCGVNYTFVVLCLTFCMCLIGFSSFTRWGPLDFHKGAIPSLSKSPIPDSVEGACHIVSSGCCGGRLSPNTCQRECQKECQKRCQKECQKRNVRKMAQACRLESFLLWDPNLGDASSFPFCLDPMIPMESKLCSCIGFAIRVTKKTQVNQEVSQHLLHCLVAQKDCPADHSMNMSMQVWERMKRVSGATAPFPGPACASDCQPWGFALSAFAATATVSWSCRSDTTGD